MREDDHGSLGGDHDGHCSGDGNEKLQVGPQSAPAKPQPTLSTFNSNSSQVTIFKRKIFNQSCMNIDFQDKSFPSRINVELPDVLILRCSDPTHAQVGARELVCQVNYFNYNLVVVGSNLAMTLRICFKMQQRLPIVTLVWSGWFVVISAVKMFTHQQQETLHQFPSAKGEN